MIAAVTNFYNPANRKTKLDNFWRFREQFKHFPLFVIEAAFERNPFVLSKNDCYMQVRCKDVIWQQYRLVNLVIQNLPEQYDKVIWVDSDILFESEESFCKIDDLLDEFKVVQSYSSVTLLDKNSTTGKIKQSVAKIALENAKKPTATNLAGNLDLSNQFASGFSWAVQRDLIEKFGIYDYWITGSCDSAFIIGIWGDWNNDFITKRLNSKMKDHYMEWAIPFNKYVNGNVSFADLQIKHLWHGERNYRKRWLCLKNFDPSLDIKINEAGVLEWNSNKPDLQDCCRRMCLNYDIEFPHYL